MSLRDFFMYFFIILMLVFVKISLALLLMALLLALFRTWQMTKEPNGKVFLRSKLPNPKPEGFYRGSTGFSARGRSALGGKTSWLGKKFDSNNETGVNIMKDKKSRQFEKYPFKTYVGSGLFDKSLFVLKIDYNVKGNPFWMRCILDEIVEIKPNEYLGKMHIRIIPGFPFSFLYFNLKK